MTVFLALLALRTGPWALLGWNSLAGLVTAWFECARQMLAFTSIIDVDDRGCMGQREETARESLSNPLNVPSAPYTRLEGLCAPIRIRQRMQTKRRHAYAAC